MKTIIYNDIEHVFPDTMDDNEIQTVMAKQYPEATYRAKAKAKGGIISSALQRGLAEGGALVAAAVEPVVPDALQPEVWSKSPSILSRIGENLNAVKDTTVGSPITQVADSAYTQAGGGVSGTLSAAGSLVKNPDLLAGYLLEMAPTGGAGGVLGKNIAVKGAEKLAAKRSLSEGTEKAVRSAAVAAGINAGATAGGGLAPNIIGQLEAGKTPEEAVSKGAIQTAAETGVATIMGAPMGLGKNTAKMVAAKALGLSPVDEVLQEVAGSAAIGESTTPGQLVTAALLGTATAPVELYAGKLEREKELRKQQKTQSDITEQVNSYIRERLEETPEGVTLGARNPEVSLPKAIPLQATESGALTNAYEGDKPLVYASLQADADIVEGDFAENILTGGYPITEELKAELSGSTFSDDKKAAQIAGMMTAVGSGKTVIHQVNEFGEVTTIPLTGLTVESLASELQALKSEEGFPVAGANIAVVNSALEDSVDDEALTKREELIYKMMNPMNAEAQAQAEQRLAQAEAALDMPDAANPVDLQSLDRIWQMGVDQGTFDDGADAVANLEDMTDAESADAGGITEDVYNRRLRTYQLTKLPPSQRRISAASVKTAEGLTLAKLDKTPGTFGIGEVNENFPREYQEAVVKIAEEIRQKFMSPESTLIINFEDFAPARTVFGQKVTDTNGQPIATSMGAHFRLEDGTHVITPRELNKWDKAKDAYNTLTVNEALYSLSHELGHAVWLNEFYRDVPDAVASLFNTLFAADDIEGVRENLGVLPDVQAAVVKEWLDLREAIPTMTAREFAEKWLGVRKLGLGVGKWSNHHQKSIYNWAVRQIADIFGKPIDNASALDLVHAMYWDKSIVTAKGEAAAKAKAEQYILSFNEFMAEQFSRYAYDKRLVDDALKTNPFFLRALNALRDFFNFMKTVKGESAADIVKAGDKFTSWVDGLSLAYANVGGKAVKKKRVSKKKVQAPKPKEVKTEIPVVQPNPVVAEVDDTAFVKALTKANRLVRIEDPSTADDVASLIDAGAYEEARAIIQEVLQKPINFDTQYVSSAMAAVRKMFKRPNDVYSLDDVYMILAKTGIPNMNERAKRTLANLLQQKEEAGETTVTGAEMETAIVISMAPMKVKKRSEMTKDDLKRLSGNETMLNMLNEAGWSRLINEEGDPDTWFFTVDEAFATYFNDHFKAADISMPNDVIAFARVYVQGDYAIIGEVQSDVLKKLAGGTEALDQKLEQMAEDPERMSTLRYLYDSFNKRMAQEIIAKSAEMGIKGLFIAQPNTVVELEGWLKTEPELDVPELAGRPVDTNYGFTAKLTGRVRFKSGKRSEVEIVSPSGILNWVKLSHFPTDTMEQMKNLESLKLSVMSLDLSKLAPEALIRPEGKLQLADGKTIYTADTELASDMVFEVSARVPEIFDKHRSTTEYILRSRFEGEVAPFLKFVNLKDGTERWEEVKGLPKARFIDSETPLNLNGLYRKHKDLIKQFQLVGGGKPELFLDLPYLQLVPKQLTISLDSTTPSGVSAAKVAAGLDKLKSKVVSKAASFAMRYRMALEQLQQLAWEHPDIVGLRIMNDLQMRYNRFKNQLMVKPQRVVQDWFKLEAKLAEKLEKALRAEHESGSHWTEIQRVGERYFAVDSERLRAELSKLGVDFSKDGERILNLFLNVKNTHLEQMDKLQAVVRDNLWKRYGKDIQVFSMKWAQFEPLFARMRATPFLPNMQFGNYVVYVQEKQKQPDGTNRWVTVYRQHFESRSERELKLQALRENARNERVMWKDLDDAQTVTLTLPSDFLQTVADTEMYSQSQIELLGELLVPMRLEKFEKRWEDIANGLPGGSTNLFRNFAAYTWHNANFIAKLRFNQEFNRVIARQRMELRELQQEGADFANEQVHAEALKTMIELKSYIMHPPNELEGLRTGISLVYLMYMAKTALMNLSSMLHTIYAAQTEYGEIAGTKAFTKSLTYLRKSWGADTASGGREFRLVESLIERTTGEEQVFWKNMKYMLDNSVRDGVIDQSFAFLLAGLANSGAKLKLYQKYPRLAGVQNFTEFGMEAFRTIEKTNRLVSMMTFFQLELEKGSDKKTAYESAVKKTLLLQNDYTRANRIKLTRGKKALFTIFLSYSQFMGWLMTGGYSRGLKAQAAFEGQTANLSKVGFTTRMWLTYALLGGMTGLPFAENILDIIQFVLRKFFNVANAEYELRKLISDTVGHENTIMHGLLHSVPTPFGDVDVSRSFGLGRLVPGTEPLGTADQMPWWEFLGKSATAASGVTGNLTQSLYEFVMASDKEEASRHLPGIIGKISSAMQDYENGIMTRNGVRLVKDENGDFVEQSLGQAFSTVLGFQNSQASAAREELHMQKMIAQYYATRQSELLRIRNKAIVYQDGEAQTAAEEAIARYNDTLPAEFSKIRITQKVKTDSLRTYRRGLKKAEAGRAPARKQSQIYESVRTVSED